TFADGLRESWRTRSLPCDSIGSLSVKKLLATRTRRGDNPQLVRRQSELLSGKDGPMQRTHRVWFLLALIATLAPAGIAALTWTKNRVQEVDVEMARAGQILFHHEWTPKDRLSPDGDGLGPVFNARSCVACHHQGGPGGAGGLTHNVTL